MKYFLKIFTYIFIDVSFFIFIYIFFRLAFQYPIGSIDFFGFIFMGFIFVFLLHIFEHEIVIPNIHNKKYKDCNEEDQWMTNKIKKSCSNCAWNKYSPCNHPLGVCINEKEIEKRWIRSFEKCCKNCKYNINEGCSHPNGNCYNLEEVDTKWEYKNINLSDDIL